MSTLAKAGNTGLQSFDTAQHQVAAVDQSAALMHVIERAALNPEIDLDRMERLFEMAERIRAQKAEQAFNGAMARAQSKMRRVETDANNPQTRSKYASYGAIDRAIRPLYSEEGFSVSFDTEPHELPEWITVVAYVSHSEGHTRKYSQPMPADGKGAKGGDVMTKTHAMGSAQTYGMRYLTKKIWNVAIGEDDDDGNAANTSHGAPDNARVSAKDLETIKRGLTATGAKAEDLLHHLFPGVHNMTLEQIPAAQAASAIHLLSEKYKRQQEEAKQTEEVKF